MKLFFQQKVQNFVVITHDFIKNHMPFSDGEFVKVYIYLKFLLQNKVDFIEVNKIAQDLNLLESDVIKAIEFWAERKLIKISKDTDGNITVDFFDEKLDFETAETKPTPPVYTTDDLSRFFETDEKFRNLLEFAQKQYCRTFNKNDIDVLLEIYDWLKLPIEVIYLLINYVTINKNNKNLKYLEQIAIKWKELNIDSIEKAEEYIRLQESTGRIKRLVLQNLGIYNRAPTKVEDEIMNVWINDWKMPEEVIMYALSLIKNVNNPTVNYVNGIIKRWYEAGLRDLESIKKFELENAQKREKNKKTASKKVTHEERDPSTYTALEELYKKALRGNRDDDDDE
ncbi:DnaD domain protein [Caldicellulosiruptor morganii]|uniref:DnaD domain protein n=1 Tax=Caldicellulosiruptor morganii TaxID=1387555 RepID=A0ABY7BQU7_9FIRM|nr:DnaD domain protein [Caldicellulosiruptor morganii]WAM34436.1 DnaD domain protein [Caldicellulosiruptor morganii]